MNFAYVQGQEEAALSYFESRLAATFDFNERQQLEKIIENLKEKLRAQGKAIPERAVAALELSCGSS